eukprot:2298905-Lingulodinium_polyedra.AAC.1
MPSPGVALHWRPALPRKTPSAAMSSRGAPRLGSPPSPSRFATRRPPCSCARDGRPCRTARGGSAGPRPPAAPPP